MIDWLIETETHILRDFLVAKSISSSSETDKYDSENENKQVESYSADKKHYSNNIRGPKQINTIHWKGTLSVVPLQSANLKIDPDAKIVFNQFIIIWISAYPDWNLVRWANGGRHMVWLHNNASRCSVCDICNSNYASSYN